MADFLQQSTPSSGPPLPAAERAQVDQLMTAYPDVLGEEHVGAFKNAAPIELHFKENYRPSRVSRAPMVPIHLRAAVRKELQTLLDQDIIRPIKPGDEVKQTSRCVLVDKPDGSVRICVDLKQVNETIAYNIPYPIPHITEIVSQLPPDISYLAVFDMRRGYLHLKVHPESQKHLVFVIDPEVMNGQGLFTFNRLPFGLNVSSSLFLLHKDDAFRNLPGTFSIVDDILIVAPNLVTFLARLKALFERCRQQGIALSKNKAQIGSQVIFSGHLVSTAGVKPDPSKVEIIAKATMPQTLTQMRSFLGMVNFLLQYHPGISSYTEVLNQLLKKDTAFLVLPHHLEAFHQLKALLVGPLCVAYYRPDWEQHLYTDASLTGVAYLFLQVDPDNGRPYLVHCGSRALRPAETRYAVSEVEAVGLEFACQKLRQYMEGAKVTTFFTDHASLVQMFKKPFADFTNKRLLRIFLRIQHLRIHPQHIAGKHNTFTDYFSRYDLPPAPSDDEMAYWQASYLGTEDVTDLLSYHISFDREAFQQLSCNLQFLASQALLDPSYQMAVAYFKQQPRPPAPPNDRFVHMVIDRADDVVLDDATNLLYFTDHRVIVPPSATRHLLQAAHAAHGGVGKITKLLKKYYYWPQMSKDIKEYIDSCPECQLYHKSNRKRELTQFDSEFCPNSHHDSDILHFEGVNYIALVDRFSGFLWVKPLKSLHTQTIVDIFYNIWLLDGTPFYLRTDNATTFSSVEFQNFVEAMSVTHVTSSPYMPSSNGRAEIAVAQAKNLLRKTQASTHDLQVHVALYNATPLATSAYSPFQLKNNRPFRFNLFFNPEFSSLPNEGDDRLDDLANRRAQRQLAYDAKNIHRQAQPPLTPGTQVLVQSPLSGLFQDKGVISARHPTGSFDIFMDDGTTIRRNPQYLRVYHPRTEPDGSPDPAGQQATPTVPPIPAPRRSKRLADKKARAVSFTDE